MMKTNSVKIKETMSRDFFMNFRGDVRIQNLLPLVAFATEANRNFEKHESTLVVF